MYCSCIISYGTFFLFTSILVSVMTDNVISGMLGSQPVRLSLGEKRKQPPQKLDGGNFILSNPMAAVLHHSSQRFPHLPLRLPLHRLLIWTLRQEWGMTG